jgi:hypothetical protein
MKSVIISLLVIAGIVAAVYFFSYKKTSEPYNEALKQEQAGNFPLAMSLTISTLMAMTDTRPVPSKSLAMTSSKETWIKELTAYATWLITASVPSKRLTEVMNAVDRIGKNIENQNNLVNVSVQNAAMDDYQKKWNSIFYPEGKTPPPAQQTILEKAMDTKVSILTLIGNPSYRYDGKAVNRTTGKSIDFTVFNEGQFSFLIPPGTYYLIVTSKASFQAGQVWESPANVLVLTIPDSTSLIAGKLITDIKRRK